ncbi:MAG: hypothetical protein QOC63_3522 [Mycobacterium sp.]|jgi:hypothetical protein|nr:hypothetical protein [Mycobacterium sp.]
MPRKPTAMAAPNGNPKRRELAILINEFAAVRLWLDRSGNGSRLLVEDLESGDETFLDPLELSSFTVATPEDREDWLRVGNYRGERKPPT